MTTGQHHTPTNGHTLHTEVCWQCVGIGARRAINTSWAGAVSMFARVERVAALSWAGMLVAMVCFIACTFMEHGRAEQWKTRDIAAEVELAERGSVGGISTTQPCWHVGGDTLEFNTVHAVGTGPTLLEYRDANAREVLRMDDLVVRVAPDGTVHLWREPERESFLWGAP